MKLTEITEDEFDKLSYTEDTYFLNGCIFDEDTDNLLAFSWYASPVEEASKFFKVVMEV